MQPVRARRVAAAQGHPQALYKWTAQGKVPMQGLSHAMRQLQAADHIPAETPVPWPMPAVLYQEALNVEDVLWTW